MDRNTIIVMTGIFLLIIGLWPVGLAMVMWGWYKIDQKKKDS